MATELKLQVHIYRDRRVSALGLRLWKMREQIESAAERGETKMLNREELERELEEMRPRDPDVH